MVEKGDWRRLKAHAFKNFKINGHLDSGELTEIINIGCANGHFHEYEKADLINIISTTTRADLDDHMWAKVADLINKFELESDRDAVIEGLPEEPDFNRMVCQSF